MKRISTGLVGAVLMFGMLPGVASAQTIIERPPIIVAPLVCDTAGVAIAHVKVFSGIETAAQRTRGGLEFATFPLTAVRSEAGCVLELPFLILVHSEPRAGGWGHDWLAGGTGDDGLLGAAEVAKLRSFGQWGLAPDQAQQGNATHRRPGFTFHYGGHDPFGLACAAARPSTYDPATDTYVPRIGVRAGPCTLGDITLQHGVTDSSGAAEVLAQAMDNTPDQAQQGLEQAWEAVTTAPAHEHAADPATGGAPAAAPAQVVAPPVTAPPVTAPPVTTPPVDTPPSAPPVDTPAGPPSDVPGGRP